MGEIARYEKTEVKPAAEKPRAPAKAKEVTPKRKTLPRCLEPAATSPPKEDFVAELAGLMAQYGKEISPKTKASAKEGENKSKPKPEVQAQTQPGATASVPVEIKPDLSGPATASTSAPATAPAPAPTPAPSSAPAPTEVKPEAAPSPQADPEPTASGEPTSTPTLVTQTQ